MSVKVGIFVDGGHLRATVQRAFSEIDSNYWGDTSAPIKKHFPESKIDYEKLTLKMMETSRQVEEQEQEVICRRFYTCPPIQTKSQNARHLERQLAYDEFKQYLENADYEVREGFLSRREIKPGNWKVEQKGVDTFIARDIATLIAQQRLNRVWLVTGDNDFLPVAQCAEEDDEVPTTLWCTRGKKYGIGDPDKLRKACKHVYNLIKIEKEIRR